MRFDKLDLAIEVLPATYQIRGVATLDFTARERLTSFALDLDRNLPVTAISVNGRALAAGQWSNPEGQLQFSLPQPVGAGDRLSIRIAYGGTPHVAANAPWDAGFVWSKSPSGAPYVATAVQVQGCDLLWPCIDNPLAEPALADIHITVPAGLSAPANGVLQGVRELRDGRRTFDWRIKNPNNYAIALNVGPYAHLEGRYQSRFGNSIPMHFWHLPERGAEAKMLFEEFAPTLDFFEAVIGPYPFGDEKMGVVETPHLGMEHQTINAYGNGYVRDAYGFDWLFQHEFAHEWFANQLTYADADDFWLHEGFGTYMQPLYAEWRGGQMSYLARLHSLRAGIRNCYPIVSGSSRTVEEVYLHEKQGPSGDIYGKAALMLHTLRQLIGDEDFFTSTRRLVYGRPDPKPGNFKPRFGSTSEFVSIVNQETGRDYTWFFDIYLREAQLPDLVAERSGERLQLRWETPNDRPFPMPVEVKVGEKIERLAMANGSGEITIPAGAHFVLDPGGRILRRSRDIDALQNSHYALATKALQPGQKPPEKPCIQP
ncbi:MAG TPA: M1 family metallopeptidase [Allosphingosinicella sp.]|nr:M1 family metallopeptidase [Allosphingosinicella sp.]